MLNFKKQMKKDSRLITNLCCKSANGKRIITPLPWNNHQDLKMPSRLSQIDMNTEPTHLTSLGHEGLKITPIPLITSSHTPIKLLNKYSSIQLKKKKKFSKITDFAKTGKKSPRVKRRRIFLASQQIDTHITSLSPKLKKRSLNSIGKDLRVFDKREILNITNGQFLW